MNDLATGSILFNSGKDVEDMDILHQEEVLDEIEDMDICELDLEGIEKSFSKIDKGYVPQEQVSLLKEAILKSKTSNSLGISVGSFKETKRIAEECGWKLGRCKSNKQRVVDVGRRLVESGQYPTIKSSLGL